MSTVIIAMYLAVGAIIGGLILMSPMPATLSSRITASIVGLTLWPFVLMKLGK